MVSRWHELFYYDETSPSFLRRNTDCLCGRWHKVLKHSIGDVAGNATGSVPYWVVTADGCNYLAHRVIWEMHNGEIPEGMEVDHEDGDTFNNLLSNLRLVPRKVNMRNRGKSTGNTSGVTGVNLKTNTRPNGKSNSYWVASWHTLDGKRHEKNFSIAKLGNDEAFRLACEYRARMIDELNAQGAGYTERHGN